MILALYVAAPGLLTLGTALAVHGMLGARRATSLGRVAAVSLGAQAVVAGGAIATILYALDRPAAERCSGGDGASGIAAIVMILAAATLGGIVLAAAMADRKRERAVLVWHLIAIPTALLVPYIAGFALTILAFSCLS